MVLPLPDFSEDLAGHVIPLPAFNSQSSTWSPAGQFEASLTCASGIWPVIESTENLSDWSPLLTLTNETGTVSFTDAAAKSAHRFYRAKLPQ
jgi:hypothetical protein